jgi:outer membrane murein-binding lipoprotein Lpp
MKGIVLAAGIGVLMVGTGCGERTDDATAARVAELEAQVDTLERRNQDLEFKGRLAAGHIFGSPLKNFFEADEFWENTYDSSQGDCAKRCTDTLQSDREVCEGKSDCTERETCFNDAITRAGRCHSACKSDNPSPT